MQGAGLHIPDHIRKALDEGASDEEIRRLDAEVRREEDTFVAMDQAPVIENFQSISKVQSITKGEMILRHMKQNPAVPVGMVATVGALVYGLRQLLNNNYEKQQLGMRLRIGFQAFTFFALFTGTFYQQRKTMKRRKTEGFASAMKAAEQAPV